MHAIVLGVNCTMIVIWIINSCCGIVCRGQWTQLLRAAWYDKGQKCDCHIMIDVLLFVGKVLATSDVIMHKYHICLGTCPLLTLSTLPTLFILSCSLYKEVVIQTTQM